MATPRLPEKKFTGKRVLPLIPTDDAVAKREYETLYVHPIETSYRNEGRRKVQRVTRATPGELSWKPLCWHNMACRQYGVSVVTKWHDGKEWHTLTFEDALDTQYWTKADGWLPAYHAMKDEEPRDTEMMGRSKRYRERHQRALKEETQ